MRTCYPYRDRNYFANYILKQRERIDKFTKLTEDMNVSERPELSRYLAALYADLISAQISYNEDETSIRASVDYYAYYLAEAGVSSYSEYVDFLSLLILFGFKEEICLPVPKEYDDALSALLKAKVEGKEVCADGKPACEDYYEVFWKYYTDKIKFEDLIEYVNNKWYKSSYMRYWYNYHLKDDLYTGYWCYVASALIRIKGEYARVTESDRYIV